MYLCINIRNKKYLLPTRYFNNINNDNNPYVDSK